MNSKIEVVIMIGSGVPLSLRVDGFRACWVIFVEGRRHGSAFATRTEAEACRNTWLAESGRAA